MDPLAGLLLDPEYLDHLYRRYQRDRESVGPDWAAFFARFDQGDVADRDAGRPPHLPIDAAPLPRESLAPGIQIYSLVHTFRQFGHLQADLDPLGLAKRRHPSLDLRNFGFRETDLDEEVSCRGFYGTERAPLRRYIELLRETYCGPIGVEYMDVVDDEQRDWLQQYMEPTRNRSRLAVEQRRQLLRELVIADSFEENLQRMYPGAKRFSLEGGTTLVTLLSTIVEECALSSVSQLVLGMAHRGRLNVLANVLGKPLEYILAEFEGRPLSAELQGYGDVKYHMGYSSDYRHPASGNRVHLSLAFNPSHLEAVNPVVEGIVRAKQDQLGDTERRRVVPLLIHGDAAFAGQGVVAETFTLAGLRGYTTGGTVHVIANNQVGFTADPDESRSTHYASDIAKSIRAPIFHVNADHPEAVRQVAQLALRYRQKFRSDVVIDLVCFRRHGHNEMDDASFTQPVMSRLIAEHPPVSEIYGRKLALDGLIGDGDIEAMRQEARGDMLQAREAGRAMKVQFSQRLGGVWKGLEPAGHDWSADTAVPRASLERIGRSFLRVPDGFRWHPRLHKMMRRRQDAVLEGGALDWGAGEALAFGSLLLEGTGVRLSGQDSGRGTFGHRHAIYCDLETGARYVPLEHIAPEQATLEVINSPLSEEAVLGFEYGFASAEPWKLVVWEAQFGDFANGAQVIIDQLIASAEFKWGRMNGLVLLLPHGYEGQGPEHSSARLERFLELCAENNLQVVHPTTPSQLFHVLRRQMRRSFRKPLVVMTPKSLLRHPRAVSSIEDLTGGCFQAVIDDAAIADRARVRRVLLCSGKIYYSLLAGREERDHEGVALVRLEQLYPYPLAEVRAILASYPKLERLVWVQEEPRNMGAWRNLLHRFEASCPEGVPLDYVGRDSRAVPATGSFDVHQREEASIVEAAFRDVDSDRVVKRRAAQAAS